MAKALSLCKRLAGFKMLVLCKRLLPSSSAADLGFAHPKTITPEPSDTAAEPWRL